MYHQQSITESLLEVPYYLGETKGYFGYGVVPNQFLELFCGDSVLFWQEHWKLQEALGAAHLCRLTMVSCGVRGGHESPHGNQEVGKASEGFLDACDPRAVRIDGCSVQDEPLYHRQRLDLWLFCQKHTLQFARPFNLVAAGLICGVS